MGRRQKRLAWERVLRSSRVEKLQLQAEALERELCGPRPSNGGSRRGTDGQAEDGGAARRTGRTARTVKPSPAVRRRR